MASTTLSEVHQELQDKYGDGKINMQTGEVS
jgi:hypothetical protein